MIYDPIVQQQQQPMTASYPLRLTMLAASLTVEDWHAVYRLGGIEGMPFVEGDEAVFRIKMLRLGFRDEISGERFKDGHVALAKILTAWSNSTFSTGGLRRVGYWRPKAEIVPHVERDSFYYQYLQAETEGRHVALFVSEDDLRRMGVDTKAEFLWARMMGDLAKMTAADALPFPAAKTWDPVLKDKVVAYLKAGREHESWCGYSACRLCGASNGSRCLTDGQWAWPEGLAHYVEEHSVGLPAEFVASIVYHLEHFTSEAIDYGATAQ